MDHGAADEFSSDGGPQFTSTAFTEFLQTWGVAHRLSSVTGFDLTTRDSCCMILVEVFMNHISLENSYCMNHIE